MQAWRGDKGRIGQNYSGERSVRQVYARGRLGFDMSGLSLVHSEAYRNDGCRSNRDRNSCNSAQQVKLVKAQMSAGLLIVVVD